VLDGNENILDKILKFEDMINSNKSIFLDLDENKTNARSVNDEKNNLALKIIPELINSDARLGISGSFIEFNQKFEK